MGLTGASTLHNNLTGYRIAWIAGRVGSYKSSLALMLAKPFLERGYRLITNMSCVWSDNPLDVDFVDEWGHLRTVIIIDEGGSELQFGRQVQDIMKYPRKMDVVLIIPSYWPPAAAGKVLTIQGLWNTVSAGLPMVVYKWRVRILDFKDSGISVWTFPQEMFGIYSSQSPGYDPSYIVEWLGWKTDEYVAKYSQKAPSWVEETRQKVKSVQSSKRISKMAEDEPSREYDILSEAAENISSASYDIATLFTRGRGRK